MTTQAVALADPDEGNYGPYMQSLTARQKLFVDALLRQTEINHTAAARAAGYSLNNIEGCAHRLAHDDKVLLALKEETERRLRSHSVLGANVIIDIAQNSPKASDRLKAAGMLLNRVGLPEVLRHETQSVHLVLTAEQARNKLRAMVEKDPELKGLIPAEMIEDADFSEVGEAEPEPVKLPPVQKPVEPSSAGLEDLL